MQTLIKIILLGLVVFNFQLKADFIKMDNLVFKEKLKKSEKIVLATFYEKDKSGVAESLESNYQELDKKVGEFVDFCLITLNKDKDLKKKFNLRRLPFTIILKNGVPINGFGGIYPKDTLLQILESCK